MAADELTSGQREELHEQLRAEKQRLEELLRSSKREAKPVALSEPIGRLTRMDAMQQQQMTKANLRAYERRQKQVNAALALMAKGDYGDCRSCEEPIGYTRLKARPEAPFCLECQGAREP